MRAILRFVSAVVPMLGIATISVGGCSVAAAEEGEEASGETASAVVRYERYTEVRQLSCRMPVDAWVEVQGAVGTCLGCGLSVAGVAIAIGGTGGLAAIPAGAVGVAVIGVGCASCVQYIHDAAARARGECTSIGVVAQACQLSCQNQAFTNMAVFSEVNNLRNTFCGCGTSDQAVRCLSSPAHQGQSRAASVSCRYGFDSPSSCACETPPSGADICGNGSIQCPVDSTNGYALGRTEPAGGSPYCATLGSAPRRGQGGQGMYACVATCPASGCIGNTHWVPSNAQPAPTGLVSDPECPTTESGCLASPVCCLQNSAAQHECKFVGRRSSTGSYCKCLSGANNASCTSCDWRSAP